MKKTGIDRFVKTLLRCSREALSPTRKSAFWLLKLMVPISLGVSLMQHFGILAWMAQYLNPLFVYLGLPGSSAVIFMSGVAAGHDSLAAYHEASHHHGHYDSPLSFIAHGVCRQQENRLFGLENGCDTFVHGLCLCLGAESVVA